MTYHEHPVKLLKYSAKNIWLLIFPILRAIKNFRLDSDFFRSWVRDAWFDILILGFIIVLGLIRWRFSEVRVDGGGITFRSGVLYRVSIFIPHSSITSLTFERPFYLAPLRAVHLRCDTGSGRHGKADMKLTVSESVCEAIRQHMPDIRDSGGRPVTNMLSVILLSLFFSSGLTGALYMGAFFWKGGDIAGNIIGEYLRGISAGTEKAAGSNLSRIPDAAFGVGVFFIGAWLLSFMANILRYSRFIVDRDGRCLKISYGTFVRRDHTIAIRHINYADIRQNLVMKLFRAVTIHISCPGYGGGRSSMPVLIPVKSEKKMKRDIEGFGLSLDGGECFRVKSIRELWQYIWLPVIPAAAAMPLHIIATGMFSELHDLTLFAAIMIEVPSVWLTAVKMAAFLTSSVSVSGDKLTVRCSSKTTFHTITADIRKLSQLDTRRTIFQKRRKVRTLIFRFEGEEKRKYIVKGIDEADCEKISALVMAAVGAD